MQRECIVLLSVLTACAVDTEGFGGTAASGVGSVGSVGDGESGSSGLDDGEGGKSSDGPVESGDEGLDAADDDTKFDLPPGMADDGGAPATGCKKVDFLFVVDNSVSMSGEQQELVAAFPGFIAAIEGALPESSDPHIMVVDTDAETRCTKENCSDETPSNKVQELCLDPAGGYACEADFTGCDRKLGAGVVHPAGASASNQPCPVAGGKRWLDATDPDLAGAFSCMAKVGTAGDDAERPMDAMTNAIGDTLLAGCNAGFLRDDAILVVTFISDDACYEDHGTPQDWVDAVVAAKNGDPSAVVALGIISGNGCHDSASALESCAVPVAGDHWRDFVAAFEHGSTANVCTDSYVDFFAQAVGLVADSCHSFEPPG